MIKFFIFLLLTLLPIGVLTSSATSTFNIGIEVNSCNDDSVCSLLLSEDFLNCQNDCPATCGDSFCEADYGENILNCSSDCVVTTTTAPAVTGSMGGGVFLPSVVSASSTIEIVYNVINLVAQAGNESAVLSWELVDYLNYGGVMVRRSEIFSPGTINDGGILYNGTGELLEGGRYFLKDLNLKNGKWYFYTIFLFNKNGDYASGASVAVLPQSKIMKEELEDLVIPPQQLPPELSIIKKNAATPKEEDIVPRSIDFIQNFKTITLKENNEKSSVLRPNVTTTVIIDKKYLPEETKSITLTIGKDGDFQTFFLKKNINGDYSLDIPASLVLNKSKLIFTFINENNQALDRIETGISTTEDSKFVSRNSSFFKKYEKNIQRTKASLVLLYTKVFGLVILIKSLIIESLKLLRHWVYILGVLVIHK